MNDKKLLDRNEVAQTLGVSRRATYNLDLPEGLQLRMSGNSKKFWMSKDIDQWLESKKEAK